MIIKSIICNNSESYTYHIAILKTNFSLLNVSKSKPHHNLHFIQLYAVMSVRNAVVVKVNYHVYDPFALARLNKVKFRLARAQILHLLGIPMMSLHKV